MILYSAVPTSNLMIDLFRKYRFWRFMFSIDPSPKTVMGKIKDCKYAIDNGAFHYFNKQMPYDPKRFFTLLSKYGDNADFVVIPDVVENARETFQMFWKYNNLINYPKYFVLQDGMVPNDLKIIINLVDGLFLGGSTDYKLKNIRLFADYCRLKNKKLHVGRVSSPKRIKKCMDEGAHSIDGSGYSRFKDQLKRTSEWFVNQNKQLNFGW